MASLYVVNTLDSHRAVPEGFDSRQTAKVIRDKLNAEGKRCVVSRGPDHPLGASRVDPSCTNKERTSRKRLRIKKAIDETLAELRR